MSESCYNKIFENIKSNLVPKVEYEEAQLEMERLKSELKNTKEDLKALGSKYEEQKLKIEIYQAEKECLESENKTLKLKSNELSLKLKLKTNQYDSLLLSGKTDCKSNDTEKMSTGSQTIKEEPTEIGIVNIPTSSSGIGKKRPSPESANFETRKIHKSKEKKPEKSNSRSINTRKSIRNERKFSCKRCLCDWGNKVQKEFGENPNKDGVPDPKRVISTFSNIKDYKHHLSNVHGLIYTAFCEDNSCTLWKDHNDYMDMRPHGDIICKICDLSFKYQKHHDQHMEIEHVGHRMTNKQFFDLYLKYEDTLPL